MWRRESVLHRTSFRSGFAVFESDDTVMPHEYHMPNNQYEEMGSPQIITLSVAVGDRLNDETSAPVPTPESPRS